MAIQNFIFFLFLSVVYAQTICPTSYCDKNGPTIRFPFWLQDQQPPSCGSPGFSLSCSQKNRTRLVILSSGEFNVSSIYYNTRIVILHDPNNCLPMRLLSLNLSSSPFMAIRYQYYTFLSCPKGRVSSTRVVACLSNSSTDILAVKYQADVTRFSMCKKMDTLPLPVSSVFDYGLPDELELRWSIPSCKDCVSAPGDSDNQSVLRIVVLSVVIPAAALPIIIAGISCCACMMRGNEQANETSGGANSSNATSAGLDKSTIETYRKITVDESCRIPGPNDESCPICLADYESKDTLRFMPECEHCFHVECIDTWLSMSSKCPVCRTLQTRNDPC